MPAMATFLLTQGRQAPLDMFPPSYVVSWSKLPTPFRRLLYLPTPPPGHPPLPFQQLAGASVSCANQLVQLGDVL